jgi:hypothetical protein
MKKLRHLTGFIFSKIVSPGRVFLALFLMAGLWLLPSILQPAVTNTERIRRPIQEFGGISIVSAIGPAAQSCSRSCQIQVCTRWIPGPSAECPNPGPGGGCCTDYATECDPGCEPPPTPIPPLTVSAGQSCAAWGNNSWCTDSLSIEITANEPLGGAVQIEASVDGNSSPCPAGTTCSVPIDSDGTGTVSFEATNEDNPSRTAAGSIGYRLDTADPQIDGDFSATAGSNGWYVSNVQLNASAYDATSGLASLVMSIDGGSSTSYADTALTDGVHTVSLTATDNAGNSSTTAQTFRIDTVAPGLNLSTSGTSGSGGWYRSSVQVTASASDSGSGVAQIEVSKNGGAWSTVSGPVTFTDGVHTYRFRATDHAGNIT